MLAQQSVGYISNAFLLTLILAFCKNTFCIYLIYTFLLYKKIDFLFSGSMTLFLGLQQLLMVKKCNYREML